MPELHQAPVWSELYYTSESKPLWQRSISLSTFSSAWASLRPACGCCKPATSVNFSMICSHISPALCGQDVAMCCPNRQAHSPTGDLHETYVLGACTHNDILLVDKGTTIVTRRDRAFSVLMLFSRLRLLTSAAKATPGCSSHNSVH